MSDETVTRLPLSELFPFPNQPYGIRDDAAMLNTIDSVKAIGVITPAIVRPRTEGGYEIIAGHRRKVASERAGFADMPCIIRSLSDDEAIIQLVDSNAQREDVLPSERAKAYQMRLEAAKRQGARTDLTSPNISAKFRSDDDLGGAAGVSGDTIRNIVSLNKLIPELLDMVDEKQIALTPAYQIASLSDSEQRLLLETINSEQATPSVSQAKRMRQLSQAGTLNEDTMLEIMMEQKKPQDFSIMIPMERLKKYFPKSYSPAKMEDTIFKLLEAWQRKRQRSMER